MARTVQTVVQEPVITNSDTNTTRKYNTDYSSIDYLDPNKNGKNYTPKYEQAKLNTIAQQANAIGYENPYTWDDLFNVIYQPKADAQLKNSLYGVQQGQNQFARNMQDLNRSTIDALRSETADRIASGTSRAMSDANVLKSILGLQQESIGSATELAQQNMQAYKDYGNNLAQAYEDAYNGSFEAQKYLADSALEYYWDQQQSLDAKYSNDTTRLGNMYNADMGVYSAALANLMAQIIEENTTNTQTTSGGTTTTITDSPDAPSNVGSYTYNGGYDSGLGNAGNAGNTGANAGAGSGNPYGDPTIGNTVFTSSKTKAKIDTWLAPYDNETQKKQMQAASSTNYTTLSAAKAAANKVKGAPMYQIKQISETDFRIVWDMEAYNNAYQGTLKGLFKK